MIFATVVSEGSPSFLSYPSTSIDFLPIYSPPMKHSRLPEASSMGTRETREAGCQTEKDSFDDRALLLASHLLKMCDDFDAEFFEPHRKHSKRPKKSGLSLFFNFFVY
ncbi:unnamed protein product, partial [Mesorhabditis belari]|uniref:Uncharacterized protein n=1 Tax=Mesorhabditis belari TaxID=2138241 RepID=A0AAF3J6I2_9BILA